MLEKDIALVTGGSRGLGHAICKGLGKRSWTTVNVGRSKSNAANLNLTLDFNDIDCINSKLKELDDDIFNSLKLIVLNAAVIGDISNLSEISYSKLISTLNVNLISNKILLDYILHRLPSTSNTLIIAISSGASSKPVSGLGLYCTSKAALNMLIKNYANENHGHHFVSICPGMINTNMQKEIQANIINIPDLNRLNNSIYTIPSASEIADKLLNSISLLNELKSGSFVRLSEL